MPLNILEGLDLDFNSWLYTNYKLKHRQAFFSVYDSVFQELEAISKRTNGEFYEKLEAIRKDEADLNLDAIQIEPPALFPPEEANISGSSDPKEEQQKARKQPKLLFPEDAESLESRDWINSGRNRYKFSEVTDFELPDEWTILRFTQGDNFKVARARKRIVSTILWRYDMKVYRFQDESSFPESYEEYSKHRIMRLIGFDNKGQPIYAERFGETLARKNIDILPLADWMECIIYDAEILLNQLRELSREKGRPMHRIVNIYDMENFRMKGAFSNYSFLKKLDNTLSPNYPELVDKIIVVNAGYRIAAVYNTFVRSFIDPITAEKVQIKPRIIRKKKVTRKITPEEQEQEEANQPGINQAQDMTPNHGTTSKSRTMKYGSFVTFFRKKNRKVVIQIRYKNGFLKKICDVDTLPRCYGGKQDDPNYPHREGFEEDAEIPNIENFEEYVHDSKISYSTLFSRMLPRRRKRKQRNEQEESLMQH